MMEWYHTFHEDLWRKPDYVGSEEASFCKALCLCRGSAVLDAPTGTERIAVHLARYACVVTGIDLRASFIQRARSRFNREGLSAFFAIMDLRKMSFRNEFQGANNWSGSFGYFSDDENLDVLNRYACALRNGGRLLVEQLITAKSFFKPVFATDTCTSFINDNLTENTML